MFVIEINDTELLDDFASFLEYKLPGVVNRDAGRLVVELPGRLAPMAQERILRRLHWAWRVEHGVDRAPVRFTYVPRALAERR